MYKFYLSTMGIYVQIYNEKTNYSLVAEEMMRYHHAMLRNSFPSINYEILINLHWNESSSAPVKLVSCILFFMK